MMEEKNSIRYFVRKGYPSGTETLYKYGEGQGYRWVEGDWEENVAVLDAIFGEGSWSEFDEITEDQANAWITNQPD
jgi:hypothetical protein